MMLLLLFFTTFLVSFAQSDPPLCTSCSCENKDSKFRVTCHTDVSAIFNTSYWSDSSNNIYPYQSLFIENIAILELKQTFPPSNITYLKLENTSTVNIGASVFKNLQNLLTLSLAYNNIEIIHPDAFDGIPVDNGWRPLKALTYLHLDHNRIHSLDGDVFEHTPNVKVLTLSHNPFKVIDRQTEIAISSLAYLKELDLSYCQLSVLPDNFLHTPKFLAELDLSGNQFTAVPKTLGLTHSLTILYFNSNPIVNLTSENGFPSIPTLKALHFSNMHTLRNISKGALSKLENLEELYCFENTELSNIDTFALASKHEGDEFNSWPPIKKLYLQDNKLAYIDMELIVNWRNLVELDLTNNPWTCECENQWIVDELMPMYLKLDAQKAKDLKCAAPIEMVSFTLYDISQQERTMRCLDLYGHRPERDGMLLVGILAGVLITIPLVLFIVYAYQRHWFGLFDSSPAGFSRQFYSAAAREDVRF